jgi:hypothetical protein
VLARVMRQWDDDDVVLEEAADLGERIIKVGGGCAPACRCRQLQVSLGNPLDIRLSKLCRSCSCESSMACHT